MSDGKLVSAKCVAACVYIFYAYKYFNLSKVLFPICWTVGFGWDGQLEKIYCDSSGWSIEWVEY